MMKFIHVAMIFLTPFLLGQENDSCSFGIGSDTTSNGENITTGGAYEYAAASDFDVPFGTIFTVEQIKFIVLKSEADLAYVNVSFLEEFEGVPGEAIHTFENLLPISQVLAYESELENMDAYEITVELPSSFELLKGKYFLQLTAAPGDDVAVSWEITDQETTSLGRFDFFKFDEEPWFGGFSYYDHAFEVIGSCNPSGEEEPDYGEDCSQGVPHNEHTEFVNLLNQTLADDFIVEENTTYHLSGFKISTLQLGNIQNATIKIRNSENGMPGEVLYEIENKGPKTENYYGYWAINGYPLEVVAVDLEFELDEPIELSSGAYFLELSVSPFMYTDFLAWEGNSVEGIGSHAFVSNDGGNSWDALELDLALDIFGYCSQNLDVQDSKSSETIIYPNPVQNQFTIQTQKSIKKVSVFTSTGQFINSFETDNKIIKTTDWVKGVYIIEVTFSDGKKEIGKIIKN